MPDSEWARIERIFHNALEQKPHERAAFLSDACGGDRELLAEVESLIRALADGVNFFVSEGAFPGPRPAQSRRSARCTRRGRRTARPR